MFPSNLMPIAILAGSVITPFLHAAGASGGPAREILFNQDWAFSRGDVVGGESTAFDDSGWRQLNLPHDYSIEDVAKDSNDDGVGPFTRASAGGASTGHTAGGIGWYRKTFTLQSENSGRRVLVNFDGVYMNSEVWINGHRLGEHPNGYTSFAFELTPHLFPAGKPNVLAVKVRNEGENSRWYSGSGIYRDVTLIRTGPVYVQNRGVFVTTPTVSSELAEIRIEVELGNDTGRNRAVRVVTDIVDPSGKVVESVETPAELRSAQVTTICFESRVGSPILWSPDTPALYHAVVRLLDDDLELDLVAQPFGIRGISFSAEKGFLLNGKSVLLKGACIHHDNGPLGAAAFPVAEARKIRILKERGFNAIRTAHNPPSTAFLDACDRLGMLVIDEAFDQWQHPKKPQDYHRFFDAWWERDLVSMLRRDRNHPSVIMWSFGNEIYERADEQGLEIARHLIAKIHQLDPTRPATQAICKFWEYPKGRDWEETAPAYALLDTHGYNYEWRFYESDHEQYPERVMYGSESLASEAFDTWAQVEKHPYVIGDFVWTGMDYLGESGIGRALYLDTPEEEWLGLAEWSWYNANCGDVDILGHRKPPGIYRDVLWDRSEIELVVRHPVPEGKYEHVSQWGWPLESQSWNWSGHEGEEMSVVVYTSCSAVRLELNGEAIETTELEPEDKLTARFQVRYQPGELTAVGLEEGKEVVRTVLQTTGTARRLVLHPECELIEASSAELAYINLEVVDDAGNRVPDAVVEVRFAIDGLAKIQAVGNAKPDDMKSFQSNTVRTHRGRCQLILRSSADAKTITVRATAEGFESAICTIHAGTSPNPR